MHLWQVQGYQKRQIAIKKVKKAAKKNKLQTLEYQALVKIIWEIFKILDNFPGKIVTKAAKCGRFLKLLHVGGRNISLQNTRVSREMRES